MALAYRFATTVSKVHDLITCESKVQVIVSLKGVTVVIHLYVIQNVGLAYIANNWDRIIGE